MTRLATVAAAVAALAVPAQAFHPHGGTSYTYRVHGHGAAPALTAAPQSFSFATVPTTSYSFATLPVVPQAFSFGLVPAAQSFSFGLVPATSQSLSLVPGTAPTGATGFGLIQDGNTAGRTAASGVVLDTLTPAAVAALREFIAKLTGAAPGGGGGVISGPAASDLAIINGKLDAIIVLQSQVLQKQAEADKKLDKALELLNAIKK